jgi:hypothetical protein
MLCRCASEHPEIYRGHRGGWIQPHNDHGEPNGAKDTVVWSSNSVSVPQSGNGSALQRRDPHAMKYSAAR